MDKANDGAGQPVCGPFANSEGGPVKPAVQITSDHLV